MSIGWDGPGVDRSFPPHPTEGVTAGPPDVRTPLPSACMGSFFDPEPLPFTEEPTRHPFDNMENGRNDPVRFSGVGFVFIAGLSIVWLMVYARNRFLSGSFGKHTPLLKEGGSGLGFSCLAGETKPSFPR